MIPERDTEILYAAADSAIHLVRHLHHRAGTVLLSMAFAYGDGKEAVPVICSRLAVRAIEAMWLLPGFHGVTKPIWPTRSGRTFTEAHEVPPASRWAGRYIAARSIADDTYSADLIAACSKFELSQGVEALLQIAALWITLAEGIYR